LVRRGREVGNRRSFVGFMNEPRMSPPLVLTLDYILTCPPFINVSDPEGATTVQLTTARNHRGGLTGHLLAWHQAEYLSFVKATR